VIAAALEVVGFEKRNITVLKDADQPTLRVAMADFIERIEKAGSDAVVFLYYSGHGAADRTDRGENYLIPVGAKITLARQLPILGVSLSEITKALERVPAKASFVIVDACRNVAFTKGLKDAAKGFVPERKLDGMIVAFATRPGETAEDNNVYASTLAGILPTPGLRAEEVFKETQLKVADLTKGTQIPWTEDGLLTRFRFKDTAQESAPSPPAPALQSSTSFPYDGIWVAHGTSQNCALKHGVHAFTVTGGELKGAGNEKISGRVSKDGSFKYTKPGTVTPTDIGTYTGKLEGDAGTGRYRFKKNCYGSVMLKRVSIGVEK
jgi:uncharacterized caspase-like protein